MQGALSAAKGAKLRPGTICGHASHQPPLLLKAFSVSGTILDWQVGERGFLKTTPETRVVIYLQGEKSHLVMALPYADADAFKFSCV